jgi:hypothetical protein
MNEQNNDSTINLGSWLISVGAPASITDLMPSEITGLDIAPLMTMLGGVGITSGVRNSHVADKPVDAIRWLPIHRL